MAGRDVHFVKQTPTFIKNFKNHVDYKEPDNVDSKFKKLEKSTNEDDDDRDGELPAVVLGSNVTEEEANEFLATREEDDIDEGSDSHDVETQDAEQEGKFVFKKPKKRKSEDKPTEKDSKKKMKDKHNSKPKSSSKAVKNSSLLSFGDDEEDEG